MKKWYLLVISLVTFTLHASQKTTEKIVSLIQQLTPDTVNNKIQGPTYNPYTPLAYLIFLMHHRNLDMSTSKYATLIDHMLNLGANPTNPYFYPIIWTAQQGHYRIFQKLLSKLDPSQTVPKKILLSIFNDTSHNVKHTSDTCQMITDLISRGAKVDEKDNRGQTTLFSFYNTPETFHLFLNLGVDPAIKDNSGKTCYETNHSTQYYCTPKPEIIKTLRLHQSLSPLYTQHHKNTLLGTIFIYGCLQCFQGNPETIHKIICRTTQTVRGTIEGLLKPNALHTFLIPEIKAQLPYAQQEIFTEELQTIYPHLYKKSNCGNCCAIS
ncbi:hypothetical protein KBD08_04335 [Candidatus Babeliales bacterium]|nr:hypothetical protein [Candidatus Babeliales bacterium]